MHRPPCFNTQTAYQSTALHATPNAKRQLPPPIRLNRCNWQGFNRKGLMIKPYPAYSAAHIWHDSIHFPMKGKGVNLYELSLSGLDTERIPFLWANPHPTALKSEFQPI
ncbi:hypothetical protein NM134_2164 [Neisseria meningitidis NM134]|nr:hypothetical protein NM134_2164 [Neisseria meningitidis NM134]